MLLIQAEAIEYREQTSMTSCGDARQVDDTRKETRKKSRETNLFLEDSSAHFQIEKIV